MQNYIKNLNYQTFYQKNNGKSIFLSLFDSNQSKNDIISHAWCVRKQKIVAHTVNDNFS